MYGPPWNEGNAWRWKIKQKPKSASKRTHSCVREKTTSMRVNCQNKAKTANLYVALQFGKCRTDTIFKILLLPLPLLLLSPLQHNNNHHYYSLIWY